ncbi:MAG: PD40 domain-containing protein [Candidatus Latescibacteria bacterium]|nr:PD40 domain-containing protein [Candidatus Latescibacterota bacterium]
MKRRETLLLHALIFLVFTVTFVIVLMAVSQAQILPSASGVEVKQVIALPSDGGIYMRPTWSPDGTMIAFTHAKFRGIEVMNSDGSGRRTLTDDLGAGYKFAWSADSKEIAYRATRFVGDERYQTIKKVSVVTGHTEQLSTWKNDVRPPYWTYSTRGESVSFISGGARINILLRDKGQNLLFSTMAAKPWASQILYYENQNIWIVNEDGTQRMQLTHDIGFDPVWSPDRSKIVYSRWDDLVVINPDGSGEVALGRGINPTWSPDSTKIAYQVTSDDGHKITQSELYVINIDGTGRTQLTHTADEVEVEASWSPDGKKIAYRSAITGQIYVLALTW